MPTELDRETFSDRLARLYAHWQKNKQENGDLDAICVISGSQTEESYLKSSSIQQWLFGVEINDSAIIFLDKTVIFIASPKKIAFFKQVEQGKENRHSSLAYKFIQREKTADTSDMTHFKEAIELIKKSHGGHRLGMFLKEKHEGDFVAGWNKAVDQAGFEKVDASPMIAMVLAVKDDKELACVKKASEITNKVFSKCLKDQIINTIDGEKKVKHAKLADTVEESIKDSKFVSADDRDLVETCYPAIIQSGGNFSLKFSATSDKNFMHFGCIVCAMGFRYKNYCSNLVRTLMVDPTERMQENYKFLLKLEEELIDSLREGMKINQVYDKIRNKCEQERPDLVEKLTPNFGFVIGLEFREPSLLITNKCTAEIKSGMTFQVSIGFSDLVNPEGKDDASRKYALFIGDTVQVNKENEPATLLTPAKKKIENIGIFIKEEDDKQDDDDEEESKEGTSGQDILSRVTRGAVLQNKTRSDTNQEQARREHQKELLKKLNADAKDRLLNLRGQVSKEKVRKVVTSYRNGAQMPYNKSELQELKIYVDKGHESVVLPVFGCPTPFHISTIKNLSTSVEGDFTYLRLNFFHPGVAVNKAAIENVPVGPQEEVFIKELTYRASNLKESGELSSPSTNLNLAFKLIKDMQKEYKEKEHEEREKEGMVKQDTLIISNNKNNPKLKDLYVRPSTTQKRITGTLEAHTNGFLYTSVRNEKLEILYNNIKHAFFQPCDSEIIILVHFHLKNAIMFGKKKYTDIQFYTEVGEVTTDLGKHNRGGDRDDILAEQAEREMRRKLNMAFKSFIEKVEGMTNNQISFEKPFRELGFQGTPFRSMALLQPTTSCLINLTEQPPFVLTLDQVEIVHFERVSFSLKNFDMVFIFKDYTRKVVMITSIPMSQIDQIKEWLNSCDIKYTEGVQSFNWPKIMKTINDDLKGFFETGGWSFLEADSDENEAEGGEAGSEDSDAEDDVYEPSESESEYSESDDDDESESEYTESSESESGSGSDDSESGKDWSDLEEEARRADMERDSDDDDDDRGRKRKKPAPAPSSSKNAPKRAKK